MKNVKLLLLTILGTLSIQYLSAQCAFMSYATTFNTVVFVDSSNCTNAVSSMTMWNYGDGNFGTGAWVSHTYASTGTYNVVMYSVDSNRAILDSATAQIVISNIAAGNCASFTWNANYLSVAFVDNSTCSGAHSFDWSYGDGTYGSGSQVSHIYTSAGTYSVALAVMDSSGNLLDTASTQITVSGPPPASCRAYYTKVQARDSMGNLIPGHLVIFNQSSANNPTYSWDFGDGNTSTAQNPTHTYTGNGPYNLCLTITDSNCTDTYCDSVGVDSNGVILRRGPGFTIHVGGYNPPPVGITEISQSVFSVYPNPADNQISITTEKEAELDIRLVNTSGQVVMSLENVQSNGLYELNVSDLKGLHLLQVSVDGAAYQTSKLLIQ